MVVPVFGSHPCGKGVETQEHLVDVLVVSEITRAEPGSGLNSEFCAAIKEPGNKGGEEVM